MKNRIVTFFLVFSFLCSLCVPVSAVPAVSGIGFDTNLDVDSARQWRSFISGSVNGAVITALSSVVGIIGHAMTGNDVDKYAFFNWLVETGGYGEVDETRLKDICREMNSRFNSSISDILASGTKKTDAWRTFIASYSGFAGYNFFQLIGVSQKPYFRLAYDYDREVHRIKEMVTGYWLVDSEGRFACFKPESASYDLESSAYADQWIQSSTLDTKLASGEAQFRMTSKAALESMVPTLGSGVRVQRWHEYYVIVNLSAGNSRSVPIRCTYDGNIYACWYNDKQAAVNEPRTTTDITDDDGNDVPIVQNNDTTEINYNGMTIVLPDGDFNIGEINYNSNNKTYNVEAYKYDITNNYYYTYNYSWTYHINYTSITYIGQSEEYDKTYKVYYQLPDGRSSADLTAEELEQLNLAVDVINYGRSADDTRLRSLYHFDGNTSDASYWNYATEFTWNTGASLTYLESGNFNGALYLDETDHDFTLRLPSALGTDDFTLQFRYYQSATVAPQDDSYIRFGSIDLLRFNGSQILDGSSAVLSAMPIGSWNELAIVRQSGTVRYYLNGVQLGAVPDSTAISAAITFHFGSSQQTYKELDELRVLNYAFAEDGVNYTPTSVPYDTNLALVLPDSVVPVADEYWNVQVGGDNLLSQYNLDYWDSGHLDTLLSSSNYNLLAKVLSSKPQYSKAGFYPVCNVIGTPVIGNGYSIGSASSPVVYAALPYTDFGGYTYYNRYYSKCREGCLSFDIVSCVHRADYIDEYYLANTNYVFTIVFSSGEMASFTFMPGDSYWRTDTVLTLGTSHGYTLELVKCRNEYDGHYYYCTSLNLYGDANAGEFVYLCLEEGTESTVTAEFVSSITPMDSASLNTPTLAIRSDIPVTNYQIGGVRPSIPYKGLVWAMVESGYITSLQIYDGRAWVQCDGRIWTGKRWIPYSSYNVVTLSDMYDITDASGQSGYEYIYTDSGFWSWFQKAWLDFRGWTGEMLSTVQNLGSGNGGSGGGDSVVNDLNVDPDSDDDGDIWFVGFVKRIVKLGGRAVRGVSDIVIEDALSNVADGLGDMQSFYSAETSESDSDGDGYSDNLYGFPVYDAQEVWQ